MVQLVLEIFGLLIGAFFGALVGVLWPPKSPTWSRWQKIGMGFGIAAIAIFLLAFGAAHFRGWAASTWWLFGIACLLTVIYMTVGNVCRTFHESRKGDSEAKGRRALRAR